MENKNQISFGDYINTYEKEIQSSIGFIGQKHDFFIKVKADIIIETAKATYNEPKSIKILDIGCGIGLIDNYLCTFFNNLNGVDIEESVVEKAKKFNPGVKYRHYNGSALPFENNFLDLVFAINVMHHVIPSEWENFTKEMHRVLKPGGVAMVFEHNPLNPLTRLAVDRCEFDRDAVLLHRNRLKKLFRKTGLEIKNSSYILFFPMRNNFFRKTEKIIKWLPLGAQFYITGEKRT